MTPAEKITLSILRGDKCVYEESAVYDIWSYSKDGGTVAAVRDVVTGEILYEDLPIAYMVVRAPFVVIQTVEDREV